MLFPAANDLLTMFVALEVLSLPLYLLCGLARRRRLLCQEAALKYFLLGAFSSAFFLYGVALLYGYAGSMRLSRHRRGGLAATPATDGAAARRHRRCSRSACCSRSAPRRSTPGRPTSTRAPRPRSPAFMAACTKVAAFGALLRLFYVGVGADRWDWQPMIWVVAILTMVVGAVLALTQTDIKRMLAYSSIAHAGLPPRRRPRRFSQAGDRRRAVLPRRLRLHDVGAFASSTLVRDAGGEATHLSQWAGLGKQPPGGRRRRSRSSCSPSPASR